MIEGEGRALKGLTNAYGVFQNADKGISYGWNY